MRAFSSLRYVAVSKEIYKKQEICLYGKSDIAIRIPQTLLQRLLLQRVGLLHMHVCMHA